MYTLNFKAIKDKRNPQFVKVVMVIYKQPYARVYKVTGISGLAKDWNEEKHSFKGKNSEQNLLNSRIAAMKTKYSVVADEWDDHNVDWTPRQLSAHFDQDSIGGGSRTRQVRVLTISQMYDLKIEKLKGQKKIKNGNDMSRGSSAQGEKYFQKWLDEFTKARYGRALSTYYFPEVTEDFLEDYAYYSESKGAKNGNKGGVKGKIFSLYKLCKDAQAKGIPGIDLDVFDCMDRYFQNADYHPKTIPFDVIVKMECMDRSLFTKAENFLVDMFLFSFYAGGMGPIDVAFFNWGGIHWEERFLDYERIKYPKRAKPPLIPQAIEIIERYKGQGAGEFVFPIIKANMTEETQRRSIIGYYRSQMSIVLKKVCDIIGYDKPFTWYAARGTFITRMIDLGFNVTQVAGFSGNSPLTIQKNYYKVTNPVALSDEVGNALRVHRKKSK